MKRIHFALFLCFFSVLAFNCQKELSTSGFGSGNTENDLPAPVTATLQGNIYDENNLPAADVQIKVGAKTSVTNANGYFRIINAALDEHASLVIAKKQGYFKAYRTFNATSGVNQIVIKLIKKSLAGSVGADSGGEINLSNGSKVFLPANSIIKEFDSSSYSGSVNVYAHYIDPALPDIDKTIPGSFMADDRNNKRVSLVSFGMMAVELESASGEKLQIAKGNTAKLTISIPSSSQSSAPSTISLWYIDEQTGLWKEEGTATKSGTSYVGEVKHFSFWNADFSEPAITVSMTIENSKDLPLTYASIQVRSTNGGQAHGYTDSLGQVSGLVPANKNLVLEVLDQCGGAVYSQNIGPFTQNTNLGIITVGNTNASIVTVEGNILDCSNASVTKGYAVIQFDNMVRYASVNNTGYFSTTFITCSGNIATCEILAVDETSQEQGTVITIPVNSPATDAGNIIACGNSSVEFINYNIDGTDHNLSNTSGTDSLVAFTSGGPGNLFTTYINGSKQTDLISFDFSHNKTSGVFPLNNLSAGGFGNVTLPFNITITNYPKNIGEFYEGNFTGQFKDASNTSLVHNISCSFRLRKYY